MASELLLTIILVLLSIAAFLGWLMWRHYAGHRDQALLYEGHSLVPPTSYACPRCRRRNYGRRAIEEQHCASCDS